MSDQEDSALHELQQAMMTFAYAMTRSQVHATFVATLDVKVERAGVSLLRVLRRADEPMSIGAVADRLLVHAPHVTRQVTQLQGQGLVERTRDADDQRIQRVRLTSRGEAVVDQLEEELVDKLRSLLADVDVADVAATARVLRLLSDDTVNDRQGGRGVGERRA
ncbi:MarR family winged helix-turn-helix transcriptional regulator [Streptomyces sp. NPDC102441]|uniref:MarR family winged helix-turn-helix transcriptional regulator n=1 Tax=Streptomyces sp. NPDC102441 TaxID=3366176 RepID=UPI0037F95385